MIKRTLHLSAVLFSLAAVALPLRAQTMPGWVLVWADEFAQLDGSSPDSTKWVFDLGGNGWGNSELETYTSRTNNARIEGGALVIEARQESYTGTDGIQRAYTSARLKTKGKVSWTYGRIEARMKITRGQGMWPAFWTLGTNIDSVNWPNCGEIDIMENIGAEPSTVHGTAHGPGYSGGNGIGGPYTLSGGAAFADGFHVFALEWQTNQLRWLVDGQLYFTMSPSSITNGSAWVFTQPQFLLLNVAVGGSWPGNPNGSTTFPQRLTVDYVRVYAASNVPACSANVLPNPGFEVGGLASWTLFGGNTFLENVHHLPVHSGSNVFKVFGQFTGSSNLSGAYRDVPCSPGTTYTADGWLLTPAGDRIAGGNTAWFEVSFRDAGANVLALYRTASVTVNSTPGIWLGLPVTNQLNPANFAVIGSVTNLVAPAGTTSARCQMLFSQPASAAGSVLFDDLELLLPTMTITPVPATVMRAGGSVNISFPTYLGLTYQVRFKTDLSDSAWQVLTTVTGDGTTKTVTDSLNASRRFYSVVQVCS